MTLILLILVSSFDPRLPGGYRCIGRGGRGGWGCGAGAHGPPRLLLGLYGLGLGRWDLWNQIRMPGQEPQNFGNVGFGFTHSTSEVERLCNLILSGTVLQGSEQLHVPLQHWRLRKKAEPEPEPGAVPQNVAKQRPSSSAPRVGISPAPLSRSWRRRSD